MGCNCGRKVVTNQNVLVKKKEAGAATLFPRQEVFNATKNPIKNPCYFLEIQGDYLPIVLNNGQILVSLPSSNGMSEIIGFMATSDCSETKRTREIKEAVSKLYSDPQKVLGLTSAIGNNVKFTIGYLKQFVAG